jgi:hypothetical protein
MMNPRYHHRDVTRMVARSRFLLFIRGVMFFVHDYQAQVVERKKNRRTNTYHKPELAR